MHPGVRIASLTETLGIRVTEAEREAMEQRAEGTHLTLSEWCRQALLRSIDTDPEARLMLSEVLGLRRLFLALTVNLAAGREITDATIRAAIDEAERTKFEMADKRIEAFLGKANAAPSTSDRESIS